jgi:DNA-binding MarR family transcriptional regulator
MLRLINESASLNQKFTEVFDTWQQYYGGITFARRSFLSLPPSAKFLYVLLRDKRRMSRQDLISSTFLPPRTVNYGLSRLKALGLIREKAHEDDARERVYELVQVPM